MLFHPWLREARLQAQRDPLGTASGAVYAALALTVFFMISPGVQAVRAAPGTLALICAAVAGMLAYRNSRTLRILWRHGWWAALPIPPAAERRTLALVATMPVFLVLSPILVLDAVGPVGALRLWPMVAAASAAGASLGLGLGWRHPVPADPAKRPSAVAVREAVLPFPMPQDRSLPHVLDWQRREALSRWRTGGNMKLVAIALCLFPAGGGPIALIATLAFAISAAWLGVALRAIFDVTGEARRLLAPQPLPERRLRHAAFRYPAACVGLAAPIGLGLGWLGLGAPGALIWVLLVVGVASPRWPARFRGMRRLGTVS